LDLRERVVAVEAGASRHEAAERFEVSARVQRWVRFGSAAAKPIGGSTSPLEAHAAWLLELVAKHPGTRSPFKKSPCARRSKNEQTWCGRADAGCASKGLFDPARLVFVDETAVSTNMARLRARCERGERLIAHVPQSH
jgi:hypothetical protein